jgi:hypothetical protein
MIKQQNPKIKNVPYLILLSMIGVNLDIVNENSQLMPTVMDRRAGRRWLGATSLATTHLIDLKLFVRE